MTKPPVAYCRKSSCARSRILQTAIRLYREIGYRKTTVADIARGASMSPANVYRFFSSRRAIEEEVVGNLLEQEFATATVAARDGGSALPRLGAVLRAIAQLHEIRLARDGKLHQLIAAAYAAGWPIALSHADRVRGIVRSLIAAGQANGEFRTGSPMALACCLVDAMDAYLNPSRINPTAVRPTFDEMMSFCAGALCPASDRRLGAAVELRPRAVGQN